MNDFWEILQTANSWEFTTDINELSRRRKIYNSYLDNIKEHNCQILKDIFNIRIRSLINVIPLEKDFPDFEKVVCDSFQNNISKEEIGKLGEIKVNNLINIIGLNSILLPQRMGYGIIEWPNQYTEKFLPYDLKTTVFNTYLNSKEVVAEAFFDVKTTLGNYYNPIYLSVNEMDFIEKLLNQNAYYIIARVYSANKIGKSFYLTNNLYVKFILIDKLSRLKSAILGLENNSFKISPQLINS